MLLPRRCVGVQLEAELDSPELLALAVEHIHVPPHTLDRSDQPVAQAVDRAQLGHFPVAVLGEEQGVPASDEEDV